MAYGYWSEKPTFHDGDPFTEQLRHHDNVQDVIKGMRLSNAPVIPLVLVVHLSHERSGSGAEATQPSRG